MVLFLIQLEPNIDEKKPNFEDCKLKQQYSFESSKETPEKNKNMPTTVVGAPKQIKSPPTDNKDVINNSIPLLEQSQSTNLLKDSQIPQLNLKFTLSHNNSNTKPPTNPNNNQNNIINKGLTSPKNDSNQHFPNFRVANASPPLLSSNETNKPTISSLLDKKKILINSNINNDAINLSNIGINNLVKTNDESEKKFEKTSRLTSPKQIETTTNLLDTKEKGIVIGGAAKPLYKPANNTHLFNAINVF